MPTPLTAVAALLLPLSIPTGARAQAKHVGPVTRIVVSHDRVFSVSQSGLHEGVGPELKHLLLPSFRVLSLATLPGTNGEDLRLLLAGGTPGESGDIGVYSLAHGAFVHTNIANDLVYDIAIHPHGDIAAAACADGRVLLVKLPALTVEATLHQHAAAVRAAAFSPNGLQLASGGLDGLVILSSFPPSDRPVPLQDHTDKVECLTFSPDSSALASGARDGKVRIHTASGRLVRTYADLRTDHESPSSAGPTSVLGLAWGGKPEMLLAAGSEGSLYHLSTDDDRWTPIPVSPGGPIHSLELPGSSQILVGTRGQLVRHLLSTTN